MRMLTNSLSEV